MLFLDSLPTWLSWLLIIIEIIIAIGLLWVFFKERDKHGIWGQVGSLLGIIVTVISMYHTLPVTKYIFSFAPVEYYGIWSEGKKVFEGKRWLTNDTYNGYRELEVWATGPINADDKWLTAWISR